jgi:hypothetical protein
MMIRRLPMKKALGLYLAASLTLGTALSQTAPGGAAPTLQVGIKQFGEGDLAAAVFTLEALIRNLTVEPALHAKDLSQAYLYRGAAFVGLSQEENAKGSFAAALQYDKGLRIGEDKFSPRVVRVFEAARTGKTKSVLLPPSNVAKKAGIGAVGIGGIIVGVAAIGGGVAAATGGGSSPEPTPTPMPTPAPQTLVTPTIRSGAASLHVTYVNAAPGPGTTVSGCGASGGGCPPVNMVFNLLSDGNLGNANLRVMFKTAAGKNCLLGISPQVDLAAGQPFPVAVTVSGSSACPTPIVVTSMQGEVSTGTPGSQEQQIGTQDWTVSYTFNP